MITTLLAAILFAAPAQPADEMPPAMKQLGRMVGYRWETSFGETKADGWGEWIMNGTVIRWHARIGVGQPDVVHAQALMGWDKETGKVYYLDVHGGHTVYQGWITLEGEKLVYKFDTLVGGETKWTAEVEFADAETYIFTVKGEDGTAFPASTWKRKEPVNKAR